MKFPWWILNYSNWPLNLRSMNFPKEIYVCLSVKQRYFEYFKNISVADHVVAALKPPLMQIIVRWEKETPPPDDHRMTKRGRDDRVRDSWAQSRKNVFLRNRIEKKKFLNTIFIKLHTIYPPTIAEEEKKVSGNPQTCNPCYNILICCFLSTTIS